MQQIFFDFLHSLKEEKNKDVCLVLSGIVVYGTFEATDKENNVILSKATFPSIPYSVQDHLAIPINNILAWGKREKRTAGAL